MESVKTNEEELTSTMGSLMSTSKDEKNDASDSTPTSSTDAFTTTSTSHIAADDPISSTSSDVLDSKRADRANDVWQSSLHNVAKANPIMSSLRNISIGDHMSIVSEKDLLVMNITDTSTEKITENVDDIVQDLENLLGEPTTTFDFTIRPKESSSSFSSVSQRKDISMDLDDFSMDFQMPEEQPQDTTVKPASIETNRTADIQKNQIDVNKIISQDVKESNFSSCLKDDSMNHSEATSAPVHIQDNVETPVSDNKDVDSSASNSDDKLNLESISIQNDENSRCNIHTDNTAEAKPNEICEKVENLETTGITSTDCKEAEKVHQIEESSIEQDINVQMEDTGKRDQDVQLQTLTNSSDVNEARPLEEEKNDVYEPPTDFSDSCTTETSENILHEEKGVNVNVPSSQIEKVESQNEDDDTKNLTSFQDEKLEDSRRQEEQALIQDVKPEEEQSHPPPLNTTELETAEEKQAQEDSSLFTTPQEEKQDQKEVIPHLSTSQDVEMEEKGHQETDSPQITTTDLESAQEKHTKEDSSLLSVSQDQQEDLSSSQDVEMEVTDSPQITTTECETADKEQTQEDSSLLSISQEEIQNQKENISHLSSPPDVVMEKNEDQETDSSQMIVSQPEEVEEQIQDGLHLSSTQPVVVDLLSDSTTSCKVAVEKEESEDISLTTTLQVEKTEEGQKGGKDLSKLIESQSMNDEEKEEQDLSHLDDSGKVVESTGDSSVTVTLQNAVEDIPTIEEQSIETQEIVESLAVEQNAVEDVPAMEEKSIDTEGVAESLPLEQSQGDGDATEPVIELVPSKNDQNEERVRDEDMEDLVNSKEPEEKQQDLSSLQEVEEAVTSEVCENVVGEPMQVDQPKESESVSMEAKQEVTNAESVELTVPAKSEAVAEPELENIADAEITERTENNEVRKPTKTMEMEQIEETNKIESVIEPTPIANELADVQPELHSEQNKEVCQSSITIVPVGSEAVEQSTPMEEDIAISQSIEVQPAIPQVEEPVLCEKQEVDAEECTEITSMTPEEDLKNIEVKITDANLEISRVPVDSDILKGDIVDSVENSSVPIEDVAALDNVLHDNIIISSCISAESLDIFNGSAVIASAEATPSAIQDNMGVPSGVSVEEFNLMPSFIDSSANLQDHIVEGDVELPTSSSTENVKNLEEAVIENSILPLVMEDVPDLDVLNAISSLEDNKQGFMPEIAENLQSSDTLLASNSLTNEQGNIDAVPFEPCIDSSLPTVDEIFAEQSDPQSVDLPDDNLETLLAVASLQGVCETDSAYNMQPMDDLTYVPEEPPMKIQDDKIESLFEDRAVEVTDQPLTELESGNEAIEKVEEAMTIQEREQSVADVQNQETKLKEPLVINVDDTEKDKAYSPKIIIKPIKPSEEEEVTSASGEPDEKEGSKGSLKMTITKQSDTMHSILKIYDPDSDGSQNQEQEETQPEPTIPKLIIKPIVQPNEQPQSPKMSTRSSKQVFSPTSSGSQRSASPRITIKPIVKPDNLPEPVGPVKITIKPVLKPEDGHRQKHSPKLTIKPIVKPEEESSPEAKVHSPRVTIKPIVKPPEEVEQVASPRITIKPIVKPESVTEPVTSTPRVTIKPVVKPAEKEKVLEPPEPVVVERSNPKITIKPIVKPHEPEMQLEDFEESIKERIVLKINKSNRPGSSKELRKREAPQEEEKSEKLAKIKLKFSKEGGHPHIVQDESPSKRCSEQPEHDKSKRQKFDTESFLPGVTITPIPPSHSKLKEMLSSSKSTISDKVVTIEDDDDDVTIIEDSLPSKPSPIVISEESNQDSINAVDMRDPISEIPVFEITPDSVKTITQSAPPVVEAPVTLPAPRKRGRPRKVPLQVREDFKDPKEEEPKPVVESTRPKRSCRGQSVRTTLGIKPRKPRGGGRGRGSKRGMGTRSTPTPPETPPKPAKEPKLSAAKLKQLKEDLIVVTDKTEVKIEIDDGLHKSPSQSLLAPPQTDNSTTDRADIVMYEEETRMSAETSSRAQTPAKQVVSSIPSVDLVEESQSSVQSTATTESVKVRKGPRLEVHQEPEGAVISADQLAEYYWSGGGPYMLQEQVAQFLGIKSFKRKYPNIPRRVVDMQERDFIRESGLAGEAMCDLGLTAVNSTDILDIMYSDFQDKYEEYCKHQRDRQAKDLTNKQKALSLAASQEKTKLDITQQAVQSAATWNATFNKARRDQRKACMDLQTLTVHFPKGKMKQINKPKLGHYPVALVPGQFTDYYAEFTPTEINNLPLNTLCYDPIIRAGLQEMECDSQTDGSGSESDSSTSDSDSSYSGSSDGEDCTLCNKPSLKRVAAAQ